MDYCRRSGKQCVLVEHPRALATFCRERAEVGVGPEGAPSV